MKKGLKSKKRLEELKDGGMPGMVGKKTLGKGTELVVRKTLKELKKEHGKSFTKEWQERVTKDIEGMNSFDGIWESVYILYGGETEHAYKLRHIIVETLLKLPYRVRAKALDDNIAFVLMCEDYGTIFELCINVPVRKGKEDSSYVYKNPIIILNLPLEVKEFSATTIVAHEIAHFMLCHHKDLRHEVKDKERKADDLCEKWGFGRAYKDCDY